MLTENENSCGICFCVKCWWEMETVVTFVLCKMLMENENSCPDFVFHGTLAETLSL